MTERHAPEGPEQAFLAHLAAGRFMLQRGVTTGTWVYYPRSVAPGAGDDLEWAQPSGLGTVYATTVVRKRPPEPSVNVALIDLDEGPRMMSRVEGIAAEAVTIGMRVRARVTAGDDGEPPHLVVFDPAENAR